MKNLLFTLSAACCVCVAGARIVDGNLALNVQDGDVQTFDEDLLFQGWSRVFTIPAGGTAVFNGNLAMATPEGNSVFVGGAGTKVIRGGIRMDADTNEDNDANAKAPHFQGGEWILESDLDLARYIIGGVSEADAAHVVVTNGAKIRNWGAARTPSSSPARSTCAAAGSSTIRT